MKSLSEIRQLVSQRRIYEAFMALRQLTDLPTPPEGAWLEWAKLATVTPFSYLAIDACRREIELYDSAEARDFEKTLRSRLLEGRHKSNPHYPLLTLVGVVESGTFPKWQRCLESISLQFNTCVEVLLYVEGQLPDNSSLPPFVSLHSVGSNHPNAAADIEHGIRNGRGEIFSVIIDPETVFSDHGLMVVAAAFKSLPGVAAIQTERLCYGVEGVATPVRNELPVWSQSTLLDPVSLENPSVVFSWRGAFFRRNLLVEQALPLEGGITLASGFDCAAKIIRHHSIQSMRVPVVLDRTPLEARSFKVPLLERAEAATIISRERKLSGKPFSPHLSEIIEVAPKQSSHHTLPAILPEILIHGERAAPPITLITPVFNCRDYLERCIDSVLSQNYPNLEYIVLDGGSTDGSAEIIRRYEKRLSFWRSGPDDGQYAAIQEGLRRSRGEIMSWINADDLLTPYALRLLASIFSQRADIEWITGKCCITSEKGDLEISGGATNFNGETYFADSFDRPFIQQEGTFWRRSLWDRAGATLDLRLNLAADMELWTRFFQHSKLISLSVPLGVFMRRPGQRSESLKVRYYNEAYQVTERLRAAGIRPLPVANGESTVLQIPVVAKEGVVSELTKSVLSIKIPSAPDRIPTAVSVPPVPAPRFR